MKSKDRLSLLQIANFLAVGWLLVLPAAARAQTVVATIPVGTDIPRALAVNPITNKIYVVSCNVRLNGQPPTGGLTVIDGATNATTLIKACLFGSLAVNSVTNKIYSSGGGVIDGATNAVTYISGVGGTAVAVNPVTNKIYVANMAGYTYVIDGATNSFTTVIDPNAQFLAPAAIAVNPVTNKIYVANNSIHTPFSTNPGNVTVIDGVTNSTTTITDPNAFSPLAVAVNSATNKIYVANDGNFYLNSPGSNDGNVTVIDGATNSITTLTDPNMFAPQAVAVDETTNKIYVVSPNDSALTANGGVTIIDGATNTISNVKDPNAVATQRLAVDSVTNMIYVGNFGCQNDACTHPGSMTVINGATNTVSTLIDPNVAHPWILAINPTTNKIYLINYPVIGDLNVNVTVIDGAATPTSHVLWALVAGNESGTVASNPAGISCGGSCTASFAPGTAVTLTASPTPGATFSEWSDACTGAGSCNLTLNSDDFVTATFGSPGDFSVQPASVNLTAQRGGQVTDVITIAPLSGSFTTAVQLSCSVTPSPVNSSPALATCSLSPTSVTPGANPVTSTLTVTAPSQSARLILPNEGQLSRPLYAVFLPVPLALIGLGLARDKSKNRKRSLWLLCSLFLSFVVLQAGCGGGSSNQLTPPPQALNYTITITGTSGTIQNSNLVNVTVP